MGMLAERGGVVCGAENSASREAWRRPKPLIGLAAVTLMLLAASFGMGGEAASAEPDDGAAKATATVRCATIPGTISYRNGRGELLASFSMSQKSCWNGSRITSLSVPVVRVGITRVGLNSGWSYNGLVGGRDYYFEYKGSPKGGHLTARKGSFTVCQAGVCSKKLPYIKRYAYKDKGGSQISRP